MTQYQDTYKFGARVISLKKIVAEGGDQLPSVILLFYLLIVLFLFILSGKLGKSGFH